MFFILHNGLVMSILGLAWIDCPYAQTRVGDFLQ